jgi:hypothetical protein
MGTDTGLAQVTGGFAIARYDSRDGYGHHDREEQYIAAAAGAAAQCIVEAPSPHRPPLPPRARSRRSEVARDDRRPVRRLGVLRKLRRRPSRWRRPVVRRRARLSRWTRPRPRRRCL